MNLLSGIQKLINKYNTFIIELVSTHFKLRCIYYSCARRNIIKNLAQGVDMKAKLAIASLAAVAVIGGGVLIGSGSASALTGNSGLGEFLSGKFNVSTADVDTALKEYHDGQMEQRKAEASASLQTAVDNGTITTEQKTTIEQKLAETQTEREQLRESGADMRANRGQMREQNDDLRQWATDNDINLRDILLGGQGRQHGNNL